MSPSMAKASTPRGLASLSKSPLPFVAYPAPVKSPSSCTRISCTPSSSYEADSTYVLPLRRVKGAKSRTPLRCSSPESPSPLDRTTFMPSSSTPSCCRSGKRACADSY